MTDLPRPRAKLVRLKDLQPAEWNPRTIEKARMDNLRKALREDPEFLWHRPILAMKDGTIYGGNMRYHAAQLEGLESVPAIVEEITLEQAKRRALRDNAQWGEWQDQQLAELLGELQQQGDITALGFDEGELERLLAIVGLAEEERDDDFDPTPPEIPLTQPGDVYELGAHRLVCGDSRDAGAWEALFAGLTDPRADAMWTDPPYGVDLNIGPRSGTFTERLRERRQNEQAFEGDRFADLRPLLDAVWPLVSIHLKPGGPFYITAPSNPKPYLQFLESLEVAGFHTSQMLVWAKNTFAPSMQDYHYQHEAVIYGWKPGAGHKWNKHGDETTLLDDRPNLAHLDRTKLVELIRATWNAQQTDVITEPKPMANTLHPTMKPPRLIRVMLGNSTHRGDIVIEPFAGSGSTMVACHQMSRRAFMIELEAKFCDVIVRRWRELTAHDVTRAPRLVSSPATPERVDRAQEV